MTPSSPQRSIRRRRFAGWLGVGLALAALAPAAAPAQSATAGTGNPFHGNGMWIWQMGRSHGGSVPAIVAQARRSRISTLFIKSGDSRNYWRQFSPQLVSSLKQAGLRVCAWQYVYGTYPAAEAQVGAQAVRNGADCLVIDAEGEYEGKYVSASTYMGELRRLVGPTYPIGLAAFPYVHYHPSFPYSVFLGPGAAQYNQPQMYWRTIGTTVDLNFATTYRHNRIYERPIAPLGQTYNGAPIPEIRRFRQLAAAYRAPGVSWWSWQATPPASWSAVGSPVAALTGYQPMLGYPTLGMGSRGDRVVWAQQHLVGAGHAQPITGYFGATTAGSVRAFQAARGLAQTGVIDGATWPALLQAQPVRVRWVIQRVGTRVQAQAVPARAGGPRTVVAPAPASARLPAVRYEIPPRSVRGR